VRDSMTNCKCDPGESV